MSVSDSSLVSQSPKISNKALTTAVDLPLSALAGVGVKVEGQLEQLGVSRIFDLLLHLPRDYEDRSRLAQIGDLVHGQLALVEGQVIHVDNNRSGMTVMIEDQSGRLSLRFFKVYSSLIQTMALGMRLRLFGEAKLSKYGLQMHHPEYSVVTQGAPLTNTGLQPIYPTVKGLHQNKLRTLIKLALQTVRQQGLPLTVFNTSDWQSVGALPVACFTANTADTTSTPNLIGLNLIDSNSAGSSTVDRSTHTSVSGSSSPSISTEMGAEMSAEQQAVFNLSLFEALTLIHTPPMHTDLGQQAQRLSQLKNRSHPACQRLIIEELTAHQLSLLYRRQQLHQHKAPKCDKTSPLAVKLLANLPFSLTGAQQRVINDITTDMATSIPMLRLVQGDVGAGKTLVAALAACYALDSGWQVAVMAPTEILAEQHLLNFKAWFETIGVGVGWLAGKQTAKQRREALSAVVDNDVQIVVGTHALFQEKVQFAKLGLVIIDEQHRFGVEQRMALSNKGVANSTPHQLIMTATPIPRTLAMSAYGDMDTSIIDELPPGRTPITTVTIDRNRRDEVIERIAVNCAEGKQAYWVCPLVEESNVLDAQAAEATYADLAERLDIRIGLVHGKMKAAEKQAVMADFKAAKLDLLVATTVIEVGVDVPNAS
ncbi:MAG: ATP-dependent DNA helicase RecG, partial [Psychrobacter sp.]|nr:ATP-dependent DNA helicase RecG [Psychrobacter sp.]